MNQKEKNTGSPKLAVALAVLILFIGVSAGSAAGVETSWILDAAAGISHTDNVNNASSPAGKKSDDVSRLFLSGGSYFQVADYTGISIALDLNKDFSANYSGLNLISAGVSFRLTHKMGLGPSAVRLNAFTSVSEEEFEDKNRNSVSYKAGISGSRWIDDRVKVEVGYEYDKRIPKNDYVNDCAGAYGVYCWPSNYSNVYDIQGHSGIATAEMALTEKDTLLLSYRYRSGDTVSVDLPSAAVLAASSAVSLDKAFPALTAYRISAVTQTGSVGISHELIRKMSLNINYSFNTAAGNGGVSYQSNIFNLIAAYSF